MRAITGTRDAFVVACLAAFVLAAGCARERTETRSETERAPAEETAGMREGTGAAGDTAHAMAVANLEPTQGSNARGTVSFMSSGGAVRITARLTGLPPGQHAMHIHESGDCSAPDASSAGEHFNPTGMPHGSPLASKRHIGDLGNLLADSTGVANYDLTDSMLVIEDGANSIIGKAVIVHANPDDFTTQPSGNSGARLACGVIERRAM